MADLNRCEFIGRLGRDPEVRYMPSGDAATNISLAVSDQWKDKNSGERQERTTWVRVVAFARLAEVMGEYLRQGSRVFVAGQLRIRKYQGRDGQDRYAAEVVAKELIMLGDAPREGAQRAGTSAPAAQTTRAARQQGAARQADALEEPPFDDDIPF